MPDYYTLTLMGTGEPRTVAIYPDMATVLLLLQNDAGELNEEWWYKYAVIESGEWGHHPYLYQESWWKWTGERWRPIDCPRRYNRIVNFALG
jgi:hypothetical protein